MLGRFGRQQVGQLDDVRHEFDAGQVVGGLQHPSQLVDQLGRARRDDVEHVHPHRGGVEHEADVAVARPRRRRTARPARRPGPRPTSSLGTRGVDVRAAQVRRLVRRRPAASRRPRPENSPVGRRRAPGGPARSGAVAHHHVVAAPVDRPGREQAAQRSGLQRHVDVGDRDLAVAVGVQRSPRAPPDGVEGVGAQPEPQRLHPEHLGRRDVAEVDVGAEPADQPGLLLLARAPRRRRTRRRPPSTTASTTSPRTSPSGGEEADRAALPALGDHPGARRPPGRRAAAAAQASGETSAPRVLDADLGERRRSAAATARISVLLLRRPIGATPQDTSTHGKPRSAAHARNSVDDPLVPGDLEQRAAGARRARRASRSSCELPRQPRVEVGGAPAELPDVDVGPADLEQPRSPRRPAGPCRARG